MDVKVVDTSKNSIIYKISDLDEKSLNFLLNNLNDGIVEKNTDTSLIYKINFKPELYPFQSSDSQLKFEDYISREEIEMKYFLLSFLEDI